MGPLADLKGIDLTHVMAGPTCTLMLADMGADVIKIEKIPEGDDTRHTPPRIGNEAASFLMMNRNKRGLALDLKKPGGAAVLRRLLASADVLVENYAPGVIERLGFGYEDLRKTYPALIYCSLSGFGRTGPYKDRRGFDLVASMAMGSAHPLNAPYQAFEAADGWIVVGGANQRNWLRILEALQASHLAHDQR
ncbi:MAG: CoA transferase, partial [Pseudolabrys sp.]